MRGLFAVLVRLFPRPFRRRFGREVVDQAVAECGRALDEGGWAGGLSVLATALDLVRAAAAERLRPTWRADHGRGPELDGEVGMMMGRWMRDLRHAGRSLARSPGFTLAAVATLALALGANAGIFGVVDSVLLRPLPYADADRLVYIGASAPGSDFPDEFGVSREFFHHYGEEASQLEALATFNWFTATARAGDRVERLAQSNPSLSLFTTLGVTPLIGRLPEEGEGERVVLISHRLWTTWFGGDPGALGQSHFFVDGPKEIIGVLGPDFRFPSPLVDAWVPVEYTSEVTAPGRFGMNLVGRMTADADHASLTRELDALADRLPELYGGTAAYAEMIEQHVPVVRSLQDELVGDVRGPLWILMGAVVVVLMIAAANVASLFTVRAEGRGRDLAVRRAMGAGRGDLVRAQLSEALVVAGAAGAGAVGLAWVFLPAFRSAAPEALPRLEEVALSPGTVLFVVAASVVAALACGWAPAMRASRPDLGRLRDGTRGSTRRTHWGRDALVVGQTALALVLLVGSGLLLRSFQQLRSADPGYDTSGVITFQFAPDQDHLTDGPAWARFHEDFMARLRGLPGVEDVGFVENMPLDEGVRGVGLVTTSSASGDAETGARGSATFAGGDYFRTMGIEVLEGRAFGAEDILVPGSVVVSRTVADMLWPGEEVVGQRLRTTVLEDWHTVIGVVEDIRQFDLRGDAEPLVYFPPVGPSPDSWALSSPGYVVRSQRGSALVPEIRELIREVAPNAPMYRVYTIEDLVSRSMVALSFTMMTLAIAAALALALGAIGLYGVLSYVVNERRREIGVRMALGAHAGAVRRMVVRQGARVVGLGIGIGLVVAYFATRALSSMLYGVGRLDPWTLTATSLALALVGFLASYLPARRASRVDPIQSMRAG